MRKFQQWQDNQVYFIHLNNLASIKNRRLPQYKQSKCKQKSLSNSAAKGIENSNRIFVRSIKTSFKPRRIKDKGKLDQQKLIYENLLLGRRIMQTPSMLENTFRAKKKLEKYGDMRQSKISPTFDMQRSEKFENFRSLEPDFKYVSGIGNNVLRIKILELEYEAFRIKNLDSHHLSLSVIIGKSIRRSEVVSVQSFLNHEFNLKFKKKPNQHSVIVQIRCHVGNSDTEIGQFYLKATDGAIIQNQVEKVNLFRQSGALVGSVNYLVSTFKAINDFDKI